MIKGAEGKLLAIDIGNTSTSFALFKGNAIVKRWSRPTDRRISQAALSRAMAPAGRVCAVAVSSVVPEVDSRLARAVRARYGISPLFASHRLEYGIVLKVKNQGKVGADRIVNACAAHSLYGGDLIILDFGTATTIDFLDSKGVFHGGAICPGLKMMRDALARHTSKLPRVDLDVPKRVVGRDTDEAMRSGLVFGYAGLVEGIIRRMTGEIDLRKTPLVIATGGIYNLLKKVIPAHHAPDLTFAGLKILHGLNR